ncbi:hypothetical protein [Nannocystis pusilla]|uniref:EF-hand domain-containing protein n=1 Tax=Nannocystis pusilla TaxID=889268 RepID=A0ABS7TKT9_9BACT|nr:hypothetical protein [Nannocystis pusilla]MBZ5708835.1 hypothetical protein [Nannocystis pusilla]
MRRAFLCALIVAATTSSLACDAVIAAQSKDQPVPEEPAAMAAVKVQADVDVQLKPEVLDLETVNYLIKKGKVKDAEALEKQLNNPKEKLHSIDIDGDGKLDKLQIVEVKKPNDEIVFELHVIPSSKKEKDNTLIVAFIDFAPDKTTNTLVVKATYAPCVVGHDTIVYDYNVPIVVQNDTIVVTGGPAFYGWLFAVRPAYVGVIVIDVPTVHIHKHKHKHKGKWKGKGKGKWHW